MRTTLDPQTAAAVLSYEAQARDAQRDLVRTAGWSCLADDVCVPGVPLRLGDAVAVIVAEAREVVSEDAGGAPGAARRFEVLLEDLRLDAAETEEAAIRDREHGHPDSADALDRCAAAIRAIIARHE